MTEQCCDAEREGGRTGLTGVEKKGKMQEEQQVCVPLCSLTSSIRDIGS